MGDYNVLPLYSEILPRLFLGGTENFDVVQETKRERVASITKESFDTVITAYAFANPVSWGVKEIRTTFYDGDMSDIDFDDIHQAADIAYSDWVHGARVLVRCQAGLNRSALCAVLLLRKHGYSSAEAIALLREKRSSWVLCNSDFEDYLLRLDAAEETSVA